MGGGPWLLSQVEERTKDTRAVREESLLQTEACTIQSDIEERSSLMGHADCVPSPSQRGWEENSDNVQGT